mgnify:FL=1
MWSEDCAWMAICRVVTGPLVRAPGLGLGCMGFGTPRECDAIVGAPAAVVKRLRFWWYSSGATSLGYIARSDCIEIHAMVVTLGWYSPGW